MTDTSPECSAGPGGHKVLISVAARADNQVQLSMWPACHPAAIIFARITGEQCKSLALTLLDEADIAEGIAANGE